MSAVNLAAVIGLAPQQAVKYFEQKGFAIGMNWTDVFQEAHAKAFTVAGVTKIDILQDIRNELERTLKSGGTFAQFRANLQPLLEKKGWWGPKAQTNQETGEVTGKGLTPRRLKTIYDTNIQSAYNAGRWADAWENRQYRPWVEYIALHGGHRRPMHQALHGRIFAIDDPVWNSLCPTNGHGCKCRFRTLSNRDITTKDLHPSSSAGRLETIHVPLSKNNPQTVPVTGYRDPATGKLLHPDPGFSYNPAKSWAAPFTPAASPSPPPAAPAPKHAPASPPPASGPARLLPPGTSPTQAQSQFLSSFSIKGSDTAVIADKAGHPLPISAHLFNAASIAAPAEHWLFVADAIAAPDEIWLYWAQQDAGNWQITRRYLKTAILPDGSSLTATVDWSQTTWRAATSAAGIDTARTGIQQYPRGNK